MHAACAWAHITARIGHIASGRVACVADHHGCAVLRRLHAVRTCQCTLGTWLLPPSTLRGRCGGALRDGLLLAAAGPGVAMATSGYTLVAYCVLFCFESLRPLVHRVALCLRVLDQQASSVGPLGTGAVSATASAFKRGSGVRACTSRAFLCCLV